MEMKTHQARATNRYQSLQAIKVWLFACAAAVLSVGCSGGPTADYSKLGLVSVSGTVTLDGNPVPKAAVFFINETDKTHCYGVTDDSGRYTMMLNSEKEGVIPGEKRVDIWTSKNPLGDAGSSTSADGGEELAAEEDPDAAPKKAKNEKIPVCYNSRSKLRVNVESSDNALDFNLKSDCTTTSAE